MFVSVLIAHVCLRTVFNRVRSFFQGWILSLPELWASSVHMSCDQGGKLAWANPAETRCLTSLQLKQQQQSPVRYCLYMPHATANLTQSLEVMFSRKSIYLMVWNFTCSLASIAYTSFYLFSIYCLSHVKHQCSREACFGATAAEMSNYQAVRIVQGNTKTMFVLLGIAIYSKCKKYPRESVKLKTSTVYVPGWPLHPPLFASKEPQCWPSLCLLHCQLTYPALQHAPREWLRAAPRQGWMQQINPAHDSRQPEGKYLSFPAPANMIYRKRLGQYFHSAHCRRALGQPWFFRASLFIQEGFCTAQWYCCRCGQESGSIIQQPLQLIPKTATGTMFLFYLGETL